MKIKYTCIGSVRGECGKMHRTLQTASKCCHSDHDGCKMQGGYSDRFPLAVEGGERRSLTAEESEEFESIHNPE